MTTRTSLLPAGTAKILLVSLALQALLGLTVLFSFFDVGWLNIAANLGIAAVKAALVVWVFMELSDVRGSVRLFALGVILWVAILFAFTSADYYFRDGM